MKIFRACPKSKKHSKRKGVTVCGSIYKRMKPVGFKGFCQDCLFITSLWANRLHFVNCAELLQPDNAGQLNS